MGDSLENKNFIIKYLKLVKSFKLKYAQMRNIVLTHLYLINYRLRQIKYCLLCIFQTQTNNFGYRSA